jgi:hypothetical protein
MFVTYTFEIMSYSCRLSDALNKGRQNMHLASTNEYLGRTSNYM